MSPGEMKERYLLAEEGVQASKLGSGANKSVNTQGAWSNREEEWYFTNKRFLFSTKTAEISDQWVQKINALVTPE
jgi:hypothetical protein